MSWQQGAWLAICCTVVYAATSLLPDHDAAPRWLRVIPGLRVVIGEVAIVATLYALWQYVFALTVTRTAGATGHARSIYRVERAIGLPSEVVVQHWSMQSRVVIEWLNAYYAYVHVCALGIMLVWLFFWHRDRYPRIRNILAVSTGLCLAIQSIPVAPPRFLPGLGFVDTGLVYGQSVYGSGGSGISNQLAAMPSVHVLWSTLIAVAVIGVAKSRWRWLVLVHPVVTVWAVVATGNHWWADAIVAWAHLAGSIAAVEALGTHGRRRSDGANHPAQIEIANSDHLATTATATTRD